MLTPGSRELFNFAVSFSVRREGDGVKLRNHPANIRGRITRERKTSGRNRCQVRETLVVITRRCAPVAILSLVGGATAARAQDVSIAPAGTRSLADTPFKLVLPRQHLLSDRYGLRTRLEDYGVTPTLTLLSDALGNPTGGRRQGFSTGSNLSLDLNFDLEKLGGLKGGLFQLSTSERFGSSLSGTDIGNVFSAQAVFGEDTFRLVYVAYKQKLLDDRVEFRVGRIAAGDDFLVSPYNYVFVQNGFDGNPAGIFFNAPGMTPYPNATWGALVMGRPTNRTYVKGGLYNGDPSIRDNKHHGLDWSMDGPLFAIGEAGYQVNGLPGDEGLIGNYKGGFWYDDSQFTNFNTVARGQAPGVTRGNWGFYGLFDQMLVRFGEPGTNRGFGVTGSVLVSPDQSVSQMPFFYTAGFLVRGLFPSRPADGGGFGVVSGYFSNDLQISQLLAQQTNPTVGVQRHETALELTYGFRFLGGALILQADMQYIIRPGGTGQISDAFVGGLRTGINF
jgi:porin